MTNNFGLTFCVGDSRSQMTIKATLHLEAKPIPLEADCMKFQPLLCWRLASTIHNNKIKMGDTFLIYKGLRAKKPCGFNKSSII
jgi:hypothetical protein